MSALFYVQENHWQFKQTGGGIKFVFWNNHWMMENGLNVTVPQHMSCFLHPIFFFFFFFFGTKA
jgi:hypothetical protein